MHTTWSVDWRAILVPSNRFEVLECRAFRAFPAKDGSEHAALRPQAAQCRDEQVGVVPVDDHLPHFVGLKCSIRTRSHEIFPIEFDAAGNCVDMPSEPPDSVFRSKIITCAWLRSATYMKRCAASGENAMPAAV